MNSLEELIDKLKHIKDNFDFSNTIQCDVSIKLFINNKEQLIIDQDTLTPVLINDNYLYQHSCFILDKAIYDLFENREKNLNKKTTNYSFPETTDRKTETKPCQKKAKEEKHIYKDSSINKQSEYFIIEEHSKYCKQANHPCSFAIKKMSENYFLLFYRTSVYDASIDLSFRKYLSIQPGELVAYKYFNDIKNLKNALSDLNLKLRHNGKNILSAYQVNYLMRTINYSINNE